MTRDDALQECTQGLLGRRHRVSFETMHDLVTSVQQTLTTPLWATNLM